MLPPRFAHVRECLIQVNSGSEEGSNAIDALNALDESLDLLQRVARVRGPRRNMLTVDVTDFLKKVNNTEVDHE